jgi:hypothetical protein
MTQRECDKLAILLLDFETDAEGITGIDSAMEIANLASKLIRNIKREFPKVIESIDLLKEVRGEK